MPQFDDDLEFRKYVAISAIKKTRRELYIIICSYFVLFFVASYFKIDFLEVNIAHIVEVTGIIYILYTVSEIKVMLLAKSVL